MPQPPFLVDELQIEPGSGDTLTISRDSTDGAMAFLDAVVTGTLAVSSTSAFVGNVTLSALLIAESTQVTITNGMTITPATTLYILNAAGAVMMTESPELPPASIITFSPDSKIMSELSPCDSMLTRPLLALIAVRPCP